MIRNHSENNGNFIEESEIYNFSNCYKKIIRSHAYGSEKIGTSNAMENVKNA